MLIAPAVGMANLIRLLCRLNIVSEDKADKLIDEIQVRVFASELAKTRSSVPSVISMPPRGPEDEVALDQVN